LDRFVLALREKESKCIVVDDRKRYWNTPDSIFPNNWVSSMLMNVGIYQCSRENRKNERREDILCLLEQRGFPDKKM